MLSHATFTEILKNEHRTSNIERPTSNNFERKGLKWGKN
jgi:hypothetical protein